MNTTTGKQENEWEDDSPAAKAPNSLLVEKYLRMFVQEILHGDEVHRAWLLEAVECFIEGRHIPEPRAKTPTGSPVGSKSMSDQPKQWKPCPNCHKGKIFPDTHYCARCNAEVFYDQIPNLDAKSIATTTNL